MIDLIANTAGLKNEQIVAWIVVFYVPPLGIFIDRQEAIENAKRIEQNPLTAVIPLPAAKTVSGEVEACFR